jgi:hypothetical protein
MWVTGGSFDASLAGYLDALSPVFEPPENNVTGLFEFVCCLLHPSGVQGLDENPLLESTALIDDLTVFSRQDLPLQDFAHPDRTRARLALLSYCHLTEADFFYDLLINLLRVRCGEQWALAPFNDLVRVIKPKKGAEKRVQPSPNKKIERIDDYASKAAIPSVTAAFKDIYLPQVRNAVFHADYTITETDFHMMRDLYLSPYGYLTRDVPLTELLTVVNRTFAFYYALLNRHRLATVRFAHLKNKAIPFDHRLKGLIEFLFENEEICGFHVYWPNRQSAEFTRTTTGCHAINLSPHIQGGLSISVGMYATTPGPFSPLVENGAQPTYTPIPGRTSSLYWPNNLAPIPVE